jgi:hypothetical protein
MPTQLAFDFSLPTQPVLPMIQREEWLDVTDIARGVGFTGPVEISLALNDALETHQDEPEEAYDQRLFDCLWLVHLQWTLSEGEAATLNFLFERGEPSVDVRLRIRAEAQPAAIRLTLVEAFESTMR